jgi:cytochrome c oxidase subunit 4
MIGVAVAGGIFFGTRGFARGSPRTMTKEWQEATNEYFKENNIENVTGQVAPFVVIVV